MPLRANWLNCASPAPLPPSCISLWFMASYPCAICSARILDYSSASWRPMNSPKSQSTGVVFGTDPEPVPGPATEVTLGEVLLICSSVPFTSSAGLALSGECMHVLGGHTSTKFDLSPVLLKDVITRWKISALLTSLAVTSAGLISPSRYESGAAACSWAMDISVLMLTTVIVL